MFARDKEFIDDNLRIFSPDSAEVWKDDMEENYTINIMLDKPEWKKPYEKLIHEFEKVEGGLFIYPYERLHMTILGRININLGQEKVLEVVKRVMVGKRYVFEVGCLANNNLGVSIISEPKFDIEKIRNEIRFGLGSSGDDYTKYSKIYERMAWLNFVKFKELPKEKFFEKLWEMRNYSFGQFEAKEVVIYRNSSRTMKPEKCQEVARIAI